MNFRLLLAAGAASIMLAPACLAQPMEYPTTRTTDQVDNYHGTKVADPYRWLEDDRSDETAAWVAAQNKVTFGYLSTIPYREQIRQRLQRLFNYPKISAPSRRGEYFFFSKNTGLQNQAVMYVQKGLNGTPEVFLDPNEFSKEGTVRMGAFNVRRDGKYVAYSKSVGGSDWQEYFVMEVATKKQLTDHLKWIKAGGASWRGNGFYYSRYDAPEKGRELSSKNEYQKVYYHELGTDQSADKLVYEDKQNPLRFHSVNVTEDEKVAVLYISERGKGKDGNAFSVLDLTNPQPTWKPVITEISNDSYRVLSHRNGKLFISTNAKAPNSKIVTYDLKTGAWADLIPEREEPVQGTSFAGGKIFLTYLKDVATKAYVYSEAGKLENEITLPAAGSAGGFGGDDDDKYVFYTFTTLNYPPTIFKYDIASKKSDLFRSPDIPEFNAANYETKQVFYNSKDGTRVPMFLTYKKGLKLDGNNPTLLYGYGGFKITTSPSFNALRLAMLEQGFVYASANIRGGDEYGEKWHKGGMKLNKQNVFDDFIAAAEWLIANKYTSPAKLAVRGGSNGGLLVGAVINQRPELFRAALPQVGVMDMLRFQKFTIGWNWIADYGSSDNPDEFKAIYAYSPIHNVKAGVKYPATMITTADHDDRVVPAHSFKYAATMQAKVSKERPVYIRIDTNSGHGASSTSKAIESEADIIAFLFDQLGVKPVYK